MILQHYLYSFHYHHHQIHPCQKDFHYKNLHHHRPHNRWQFQTESFEGRFLRCHP